MSEAETSSSNINIDRILGCLRRRRWWVLLTAAVVSVLTLAALSVLPKRYTSEAMLVVVGQQVPERYVTPTSTTDITEALEATTHEVLSRTRLLAIIGEFELYPRDRARFSPEELEAKMRKDIKIDPIITNPNQKDIDAFKISFVAETPEKARAVANQLTSLFIQQNLESREHQATVTTSFLREQLEEAKTKLAQQEAKVRDFKLQNLGELPEQQAGNLAVLAGLQSQLQNTTANMARAQEQSVYLQSLLNGYQTLSARGLPAGGPGAVNQGIDPIVTARADLAKLKAQRAALLSVDTPQHPEVIKLNAEIAQAESLLKSLRASKGASDPEGGDQPGGGSADGNGGPGSTEQDSSIAQIKSQLQANRLELENLAKDEKQLKIEVAQYQQRLNLTPVREQQLAGLLRDYELLKQNYTDLLGKETQSQLAGSLEKRQAGQQFRLIDKPSLPVVPSFPKRLPIGLGGMAGGVVLGCVLAFLMDIKDGFLYSEKDLSTSFSIPLVIGVPLILTSSEIKRRNWKRGVEWVFGSVVVFAVLITEFVELYLHRNG